VPRAIAYFRDAVRQTSAAKAFIQPCKNIKSLCALLHKPGLAAGAMAWWKLVACSSRPHANHRLPTPTRLGACEAAVLSHVDTNPTFDWLHVPSRYV